MAALRGSSCLLIICKLVLLALFARHVKKRYPVILICATMVHGSLERQQLFVDHLQTGSFGFICPACKEKISGHPNMRNNGTWQP
jgi:hypothetical protein